MAVIYIYQSQALENHAETEFALWTGKSVS